MKTARNLQETIRDSPPLIPSWVTAARAETLEEVAFLSGAALSTLHLVLGRDNVPHALLRDRLALRAAEACVGFSGRPERAGDLRDAIHLLRPGDLPGPAGENYLSWYRAVERPVSVVASTGGRNTLIFRKRWSVSHEVSSQNLLFSGAAR